MRRPGEDWSTPGKPPSGPDRQQDTSANLEKGNGTHSKDVNYKTLSKALKSDLFHRARIPPCYGCNDPLHPGSAPDRTCLGEPNAPGP